MNIHHTYTIPAGSLTHYFDTILRSYISRPGTNDVLEIGAGANPRLSVSTLHDYNCTYTVLDVSQQELDKAPPEYRKVCADITAPHVHTPQQYDLIFSHTVAEHVDDPLRFHKNIFNLLKPGGYAIHFFPTLFALPFIINKLLPERLSNFLLKKFAPRDEHHHGKFPAHYHWCTGPTPTQIMRLLNRGYHIEEYWTFYGHEFYYNKLPLLQRLHVWKAQWCAEHEASFFCSYAAIVLFKPHESAFPVSDALL